MGLAKNGVLNLSKGGAGCEHRDLGSRFLRIHTYAAVLLSHGRLWLVQHRIGILSTLASCSSFLCCTFHDPAKRAWIVYFAR